MVAKGVSSKKRPDKRSAERASRPSLRSRKWSPCCRRCGRRESGRELLAGAETAVPKSAAPSAEENAFLSLCTVRMSKSLRITSFGDGPPLELAAKPHADELGLQPLLNASHGS